MATEPTNWKSAADIPPSLITPDEINTRLGMLTFDDGAPSSDTIQKALDNLDFVRALSA
jgi:hypothetical protein